MAANRPRWITLVDDADVAGFRRTARQLLREGIEPGDVHWQIAASASPDLFGDSNPPAEVEGGRGTATAADLAASAVPPVHVPAFFVPLCEHAALHSDPARFGLLYRLLWRLVHESTLRGDALDPDRLAAEKMARMVRRDMHKMTAFVRFRPIGDAGFGSDSHGDGFDSDAQVGGDADADLDVGMDVTGRIGGSGNGKSERPDPRATASSANAALDPGADPPRDAPTAAAQPVSDGWHVAWFEPEHHIVAATAPFFARRFAQMKWAILTPERCVRWDGAHLAFGPGANRSEAPPADAGEQLWLTYYAHIFNPARLKLAMMQKEMPRRYWHNLPEAALIQPLTAAAARRSGQMVAQGGSEPAHRRPTASLALRIDRPSIGDHGQTTPVNLSALGAALQTCRECPIGVGATQAVPGAGPSASRLMLVGEQPGDQEDLRGAPFVGPAGQLLARAFAQLGWSRESVYLTNAVKHFKYELRGKRRIHKSPSQREAAACLHWLEAEIGLVAPEALVALGATAAAALLGRPVAVTAARGQWLPREDGLKVLIALHPSALLRMEPAAREPAYAAWLDDLSQATSFMASPG